MSASISRPLISLPLIALSTLALAQPAPPARSQCLAVTIPVSGPSTAVIADADVATLRRFARAQIAGEIDYRTRYLVFAPYGFDRGTQSNFDATHLRGEVVRAHLIAGGLPHNRIDVVDLGEQADKLFPPDLAPSKMIQSVPGGRGAWSVRALIVVDSAADAAVDCPSAPH